MKTLRMLLLICLVVVVATGCVDRAAQQQAKRTQAIVTNPVMPVDATPVRLQTLTQNLELTGELTTSDETNVAPKEEGRLIAVYVQDGDPVKKGEVIAQQDTTNLQISLQQALAAQATAQSNLIQAIQNARVGPVKSTAAVAQARAALAQAKAQLQKTLNGARPEEVAQAQASLNSARSSMETAQKQRDRQRQLLEQGAISQQEFDTAENQYETAVSAYQNAQQALKMEQSWSRPEDIQSARDAVDQAQQGLKSAQAQKQLDSLLFDQVNSARAALQGAQAQVRMVRQEISDATIRAPFSGRVSGKPATVGTVPGTGATIVHLVGNTGIYFDGQISENDILSVHVGDKASISLDALPGHSYSGHVASISPSASSVGRLFSVRVQLDSLSPEVKPGMFARGEVAVRQIANAVVVPSVALVQKNGQNVVFTVVKGKAKEQPVQVGLSEGSYTEVKGVQPGEQVVTTGQESLADGAPVQIHTTAMLEASKKGT